MAQHIAPAACLLIGTGIVCVLRKLLGARRTVRAIPVAVLPFLVVAIAGIIRDVARPYHSKADAIVRETIAQAGSESKPGDRWVVFASRDGQGPAPSYSRFVGMGGRIHFQILSRVPGPVLWGPDPATVATAGGGRTWLIAYGNRVFEPERAEWEAYVREFSDVLGQPAVSERHDLPDAEWIEVVRIGGKLARRADRRPACQEEADSLHAPQDHHHDDSSREVAGQEDGPVQSCGHSACP